MRRNKERFPEDFVFEPSQEEKDEVAAILDAAHTSSTRYSAVCDLTTSTTSVYYVRDYRRPIVIDLETLWAEGSERIPLSSLR